MSQRNVCRINHRHCAVAASVRAFFLLSFLTISLSLCHNSHTFFSFGCYLFYFKQYATHNGWIMSSAKVTDCETPNCTSYNQQPTTAAAAAVVVLAHKAIYNCMHPFRRDFDKNELLLICLPNFYFKYNESSANFCSSVWWTTCTNQIDNWRQQIISASIAVVVAIDVARKITQSLTEKCISRPTVIYTPWINGFVFSKFLRKKYSRIILTVLCVAVFFPQQ